MSTAEHKAILDRFNEDLNKGNLEVPSTAIFRPGLRRPQPLC